MFLTVKYFHLLLSVCAYTLSPIGIITVWKHFRFTYTKREPLDAVEGIFPLAASFLKRNSIDFNCIVSTLARLVRLLQTVKCRGEPQFVANNMMTNVDYIIKTIPILQCLRP